MLLHFGDTLLNINASVEVLLSYPGKIQMPEVVLLSLPNAQKSLKQVHFARGGRKSHIYYGKGQGTFQVTFYIDDLLSLQ